MSDTPDLSGKKVLIVRLSALGDVIRTTPAVLALVRRFPDAEFHWLVENSSAALPRAIPELKLMEIDRAALRSGSPLQRFRRHEEVVARIRDQGFDASIDFHGVLKSAMFPLRAGIPLRIGYERGGSKEGHRLLINHRFALPDTRVSRYERNLALARYLAPGLEPAMPRLEIPETRRAELAELMHDRPILLFPGTSVYGRNKRWPADSWARLYRLLREDFPVRFCFGPADEPYREALSELLGEEPPALPGMNLIELGVAMQHALLLVSCDTGPMHLASVLGVPLVVLIGPSDPILNQPLPGARRIVHSGAPCAPCRNRSCNVLICQDLTIPLQVAEEVRGLAAELPVPN